MEEHMISNNRLVTDLNPSSQTTSPSWSSGSDWMNKLQFSYGCIDVKLILKDDQKIPQTLYDSINPMVLISPEDRKNTLELAQTLSDAIWQKPLEELYGYQFDYIKKQIAHGFSDFVKEKILQRTLNN